MEERRFSEEEVAEIFRRATEAQQTARRQLPAGEGMTLAQLQEIGSEVGIPGELVAQAARSVTQIGGPTSRSFLGLTVGVGRTIELGRRLSEAEWERLVVDLRETFNARGNVRSDGSFRQWTNGNLQALLEPTPTGHRVRLQTVKGDSLSLMTIGLGFLALSAGVLVVGTMTGGDPLSSAAMLAAMGAGMFGLGAVRLPGWARLRRYQMESVAARLALGTDQPTTDNPD
jgi:hypothetical protein